MKITKTIKKQIDKHALKCYPNECCGLIVDNKFVGVTNMSPTPDTAFSIEPSTFTDALLTNKLQAVIHSHTFDPTVEQKLDPRWASTKDMETWIATNIPWGIVATNGQEVSEVLWYDDNEIAPLIGRDFIHGKHDCYSIVRDYYKLELGITLMNGARAMGWWDEGKNLYLDNFEEAGFRVIPKEEATINDVVLFQVKSPVPNHAAVITGNNEILHHLFHRLSSHDSLGKWEKNIVLYLRFDPSINSSKGSNDAETDTPTRITS